MLPNRVEVSLLGSPFVRTPRLNLRFIFHQSLRGQKRNGKVAECKECNQAKSFNYYSSEGHWRGLLVGLMQPIHPTGGPQADVQTRTSISVVRVKLIHPPKCLTLCIMAAICAWLCMHGEDWVWWKGAQSKSWEPGGWVARLSSLLPTTRRWICLPI